MPYTFPQLRKNANIVYGVKVEERAKLRFTKLEEVDGHFNFFFESESSIAGKYYYGGLSFKSPPSHVNAPRANKDSCRVYCSCPAFYFYFAWYNYETQSLFGEKPEPYVRVTTSIPPKNPRHLPGVCKHLISAYDMLRWQGKINL